MSSATNDLSQPRPLSAGIPAAGEVNRQDCGGCFGEWSLPGRWKTIDAWIVCCATIDFDVLDLFTGFIPAALTAPHAIASQ
jgi:hypothetical protein